MVILHIANLTNDRAIGPNTNVPQNVLYGNNYSINGLYNCCTKECDILKDYKYYFEKEQLKENDIKYLINPFNRPDLVVFHSVYIFDYVKIAKKLDKYNIPYIIVPRGSLTVNAQNKKKLKKILGNILFFNSFVLHAKGIHFLTENEMLESQKFKIKKYCIIGNGTEEKRNIKQYDNKKKEFIIVFIGRIDNYHKGLDILLETFCLNKEIFRNNNIYLKLYGPNRNNSVELLKKMINDYKINDIVKIYSSVYDKEKEKALLNSDLFVHTSRLEGHPTSVIEAISYGIPVLVTPGTNMYETVKKHNLGFVAQLNIDDIKNQIMVARYSKNMNTISKNEIAYAKNNFQWSSVMKKTIDEYKKIIK